MDITLRNAIKTLAKLPGLGPRSSQRAILFAIKDDFLLLDLLISDLQCVRNSLKKCRICGNFGTSDICDICGDSKRDAHLLCVVESVADLWAIERSQIYRGRYHVLDGVLSAIEGVGPAQLNMQSLLRRFDDTQHQRGAGDAAEGGGTAISEVVIALNATIDGQTTLHYVVNLLKDKKLKISSLAHGIPIGGELNYLDEGTLSTAFLDRHDVQQFNGSAHDIPDHAYQLVRRSA
ncbi:MAG: recombination mediator RecR [Holosporales bacterium]|jgi:recombination protein RecR|nr:recombination mediator RecR [Holosporales bacterium]